MAINKGVENEYGTQFYYHKLRDVRVVNDDNVGVQVVMTVYSWVNKEARINGKEPCVRQCIIQGADFAMTPFYALLKAKFPEFTSGENDMDNSFKNEVNASPLFFVQTGKGDLIKKWEEAPEQNAQAEQSEQNESQEQGE